MKNIKLILPLFILFSCTFSDGNQNSICMIGSDVFTLTQNGTDFLKYENYSVEKKANPEQIGESIHIFDKNDVLVYKALQSEFYFYGIKDHYLFLDIGTSNIRQIAVIDLQTRKQIGSFTYTGEIVLKKQQISFLHPFIGEEPPSKPDCPQAKEWGSQTGYAEKRFFELKTTEVKKSGEIVCIFME